MIAKFRPKRLEDGRAMLNLGCGTRMHQAWNNLDFSPYAKLARYPRLMRFANRAGLVSALRYQRFREMDPQIICWDLRRGIPFASETLDVVYHSHLLEHIDRDFAAGFLVECRRVLKPGGVIRIAIPDLQFYVRRYVDLTERLGAGDMRASSAHAGLLDDWFGQMVRTEASGTNEQQGLVRVLERMARGGAAKVGELHRWQYDRYALGELLSRVGFSDVRQEACATSRIEMWKDFRLDSDEDGAEYKPESFYTEAVRI